MREKKRGVFFLKKNFELDNTKRGRVYIYILFVCARAWRIGVGKSLISLIINIKEVFVNGIICTAMARRKKEKKKKKSFAQQ